jgi:hypothetical protein
MNATIFVAPGPHFAILATDGRFAIDDVPPGRYRLSTWCERLPGTSQEITIEGERTLEIDVQLLDFAS